MFLLSIKITSEQHLPLPPYNPKTGKSEGPVRLDNYGRPIIEKEEELESPLREILSAPKDDSTK